MIFRHLIGLITNIQLDLRDLFVFTSTTCRYKVFLGSLTRAFSVRIKWSSLHSSSICIYFARPLVSCQHNECYRSHEGVKCQALRLEDTPQSIMTSWTIFFHDPKQSREEASGEKTQLNGRERRERIKNVRKHGQEPQSNGEKKKKG